MTSPPEVNTRRSLLMKERRLLLSNNYVEDDELVREIDKQLETLSRGSRGDVGSRGKLQKC